jgi:uncharacterized membrane protein YhaH (DUF805 family)
VPFLQAVFCLQGFDDRSRLFATAIISLLGFIFFSTIFSGYLTVSFAILLLLTAVLTCSTKRRLHDAKLNKNWQLVPGGLFLLTGVLSLFIENSSSYYLLILPTLSIVLLLTYPSNNQKTGNNYILGYFGPIDLSIYIKDPVVMKSHNQRIEPILVTDRTSERFYINETVKAQSNTFDKQAEFENSSEQIDIGELIRLKLLSNRKLQLGIIAGVLLIFIMVFINSAINAINQASTDTKNTDLNRPQVLSNNLVTNIFDNKNHLLAMPDNFNLYLSEYRGIIIHWQADEVAEGEFWSQLSANGDKSCQNITFNKGSTMRPLAVSVEKGSEYFASFSPLDSRELIRALAFRRNFSLCGYKFSLKGSQAVLGKNNQYAPFLEKDA